MSLQLSEKITLNRVIKYHRKNDPKSEWRCEGFGGEMIRMMGNLLRAVFCIGVTGLIGYYNFGVNGWVGLVTNVAFFALGFLLVSTWKNPENKRSGDSLDTLYSKETVSPVVVVERPVEIASNNVGMGIPVVGTPVVGIPVVEMPIMDSSNLMPTTSPTDPPCQTEATS